MRSGITKDCLTGAGLDPSAADTLLAAVTSLPDGLAADRAWAALSRTVLKPETPFEVHILLHQALFSSWPQEKGPLPAWLPTENDIETSNIQRLCREMDVPLSDLHAWSCEDRGRFWSRVIDVLGIRFRIPPTSVVDPASSDETPSWLPGARLNIADSCFLAPPESPAVVYQRDGDMMRSMSSGQLNALSNRVANGLARLGVAKGDAVAIAMPMTLQAVAAYLGIVKAGAVVVSIADSFAPAEIATRLRIGGASIVVTQDVVHRAGKTLPMYEKVVASGAMAAIVTGVDGKTAVDLRPGDHRWDAFLSDDDHFESVACSPDDPMNVLFSSGTTGDPKAIPWTHATPIKCAMDGYLHHNIQRGEVVAWPTNLGWMMGPWLIYASLINQGQMALHYGAPNSSEFCRFVQDAGVGMLGVVPSLVKAWRSGGMIDGCDWTGIDVFSSTGEASNSEDMLYLMSRAGYRPVIEYCGGTEIGGGYISGSVVQPAAPATFTTPAFGLDVEILDEAGRPARNGELFIVPPSIGLSNHLLNRDHHEVYYENTPRGPEGELLRRHGDQMEKLPGGFFRAHGRADDTMNLGGIKTSSAEIERTVNTLAGIRETAAIAVDPPDGGPSRLVIYAVLESGKQQNDLKAAMQQALSAGLNPLFRVYDVVVVDALPRTASNKVMRRVLRDRYPSRS